MPKITIHRGTYQVGGCITEISTDTTRVFIDMGDNLPGEQEELTYAQRKELVESLFTNNRKEHEAVFYTHAHPDHTGMMTLVPEHVAQYMSQGTKDILEIGAKVQLDRSYLLNLIQELFTSRENLKKKVELLKRCNTWQKTAPNKSPIPIHFGDITVIPYTVSHSVYDANMLLIIADGKRILHTGDYRRHSKIGSNLIDVLKNEIKDVDVLITEGTMISRNKEKIITEEDVSERMCERMKQYKYTFVLQASTDAERMRSTREAAYRAERLFAACSKTMYKMIDYFSKEWDFYTKTKKGIGKTYYEVSSTHISRKMVRNMRDQGFVMVVGPKQYESVKIFLSYFDKEQTQLIYSTWDGYYKDEKQIEMFPQYAKMRQLFDNIIDIHTPGHADTDTIEDVIKTLNPKDAIIGIHKKQDASLSSLNLPESLKMKIIPDRQSLDWIDVH